MMSKVELYQWAVEALENAITRGDKFGQHRAKKAVGALWMLMGQREQKTSFAWHQWRNETAHEYGRPQTPRHVPLPAVLRRMQALATKGGA
jgi:hypothetical protein